MSENVFRLISNRSSNDVHHFVPSKYIYSATDSCSSCSAQHFPYSHNAHLSRFIAYVQAFTTHSIGEQDEKVNRQRADALNVIGRSQSLAHINANGRVVCKDMERNCRSENLRQDYIYIRLGRRFDTVICY